MTKRSPPLFASLAKVKSAHTKLVELGQAINAFVDETKFALRAEKHDGLTYVIGCVNQTPDESLSLKAGEVSVQLRDALDKMAVALIVKNDRGASGVHFPFSGMDKVTGKFEPFPAPRHAHLEKKFTPEQWKLIVAQGPHPAGNRTLWGVNQIANNDKHWEGLVEVRMEPMLQHFTVGRPGDKLEGRLVLEPDWPQGLVKQNETDRVLFGFEGSLPHASNASAGLGVVFGEIPPVTGRDVMVTLEAQTREVERIVQLFLRTFFSVAGLVPVIAAVVQRSPC